VVRERRGFGYNILTIPFDKSCLISVDLCLDSPNRHSRIMQTLLLQCIELEVLRSLKLPLEMQRITSSKVA
jgi:hypothetical protein